MAKKSKKEETFQKKSGTIKMKMKESCSIVYEYKVLLFLILLCGLPYSPHQLQDTSSNRKAMNFHKLVSFIISVCKSFVFVISISYSKYFLRHTSLQVTFCSFLLCCLIVIWCLYFKRRAVLQAMKMLLSTTEEVCSREFKSPFKIYYHILLCVITYLILTTSVLIVALRSYNYVNATSVHFLWYKIDEEHNVMFSKVLVLCMALTFTFSGVICAVTVLVSSAMYIHLGDIILNFSTKLRRSFESNTVSKKSLSDNMSMFQKIIDLNQMVDYAMMDSVFFVYGASVSSFFTAVCMVRSYRAVELPSLHILVIGTFGFALYTFIITTLSGDRVRRKSKMLQDVTIRCSHYIATSDSDERLTTLFSLMSADIKSKDLSVTGGKIFVIKNNLILTVTGLLVTYGVIIFQMD